jgi:cytochrome c peroxidase
VREMLAVGRTRIGPAMAALVVALGLGCVAPILPAAADPPAAVSVSGSSDDNARPFGPLTGILPPAPPPAAYNAIVRNKTALRTLGKALFWDVQVGGPSHQACASCHFHAGADTRTVNQLNPGVNVQPTADNSFGNAFGQTGGGAPAGPNHALAPADYPFHRLANVGDPNSAVLYDTNDVASSQGAFRAELVPPLANNAAGQSLTCRSTPGAPFAIMVDGHPVNTRTVERRNTPSNINAVFNYRNFWDGRASNTFNGVNPFGRRAILADPTVRVYTTDGTAAAPKALQLDNMSAASQATGPVLSVSEMACANETFPALGRSLMGQRVLQTQPVSATDSVFSRMPAGSIATGGVGLSVTYRQLVHAAFQPAYWQDAHYYSVDPTTGQISRAADATKGYLVDELDFSLFFGMAIDAYERTLISDQSPFDTGTMPADAVAGAGLFVGKGHCAGCHDGPLFSEATTYQGDTAFAAIERMVRVEQPPALHDNGFYNIGVRPVFEDLGNGGVDPYGNQLSFTRQFILAPGPADVGIDRFSVDPCELNAGTCASLPTAAQARSQRVVVDGSFKIPGLRNVALTPPYFHNGGQKSLAEVIAFYNRGGDRRTLANGDTTGTGPLGRPIATAAPISPDMGGSNMDPNVTSLSLNAQEAAQIVAFLQSLTDPRVACHMAPFDHPGITVANGHLPQESDHNGNAGDVTSTIREVGAGGYDHCSILFDRLNSGDLFTSSPAFDAMKSWTTVP